MGRLFLIIAIVFVGYFAVKAIKRRMELPNHTTDKKLPRTDNQAILKCKYCGVHVPESEAVKYQDNVFCTLEHAKKYLG